MAVTRLRVKLLLNIALWFLITNVQATPIEYSNLLSSFYKHTAGHDRPIVVILDNNGKRLDDRDRSNYQNRANEDLGDRADSALDDEVKIHDRKLSSNRDSYFSSHNSRNQNRRPRYDDRYNANDRSFSNRYNRNEDRSHRNRYGDRNAMNEDRNNRYNNRNAMNEDRNNRYEDINDRNDANEYRYNNNRNVRIRHRNLHMSDRNSAYNDRNNRHSDRNNRYYRNDEAENRYGRNRNYRNQDRYDRLRNRNDRSQNNYNRNRNEKPIQRTSVVNKEDREVEILERSILKSPLVKTIMQIAKDVALRKRDSCEESGEDDSCEEKKTTPKEEATEDPCESNSNSCGEEGDDKNISTRGIVDDFVSDPPPKMCKESKVCK